MTEKLKSAGPSKTDAAAADPQTSSHIPVRPLYTPADLKKWDQEREVGYPGEYPFTRGVQATMYRGRLWTMRQYAGMGDAEESNKRYKYLLANGTTGLSVAFDLPTQIGLDSDHPLAVGEVGKSQAVGVSRAVQPRSQLAVGEVMTLLVPRDVHRGVLPQVVAERGGPGLRRPDDEEVGHGWARHGWTYRNRRGAGQAGLQAGSQTTGTLRQTLTQTSSQTQTGTFLQTVQGTLSHTV